MKYVLVTGGVISGVGKGIIASSIGTILKSHGLRVTSIKIDPYINIDAGTFSPYEHGEVFVLDDGGEVDLDLGNYERFLDVTLKRDNNITTGKIYQEVIDKERKGDYLGKTVQVVPHITNAIMDWVTRVAETPVEDDEKADVCVIELGGCVGDIEGMPFIEAFRQFQFRVKKENICNVHVSLVPQPRTTGEQKTKPTQASVRELRGLGIAPDVIVCRSNTPLLESAKEKISLFCQVDPEQVYCVHDVTSIYRVPLLLESQGADNYFIHRLGLVAQNNDKTSKQLMSRWKELADRYDRLLKEVSIVLVGKYTELSDSYASVIKALQHAALAVNHRLNLKCIEAADLEEATMEDDPQKYHEAWKELVGANGLIVPGGFGIRGTEGKIRACQWARTKKIPFLGVCLGLQLAVIEFSRNVLKWQDAHSTEMDPNTKHPVVIEMPEHNTGQLGGTMRLGKRKTLFKSDKSVIRKLYQNQEVIEERHRHRYEVNPDVVAALEEKGMKFVGRSEDGERMEILELEDHPYFIGVQFHPEYISRPLTPSPPYLGLLLASCKKLVPYASRGFRPSPRMSFCEDSDVETDGNDVEDEKEDASP